MTPRAPLPVAPAIDQAVPSADVRATLARNTWWYGAVTILGLVAGLLTSVILARNLGPARMGDFSYVSFILRILETVATLGFGVGVVRYTADAFGRGEPGLAAGFLRMFLRAQIVSTAIVAVAVTPIALLFAPGDVRLAFLAAVATLFPLTIESVFIRATYGAQRYDYTAQVSTLKMTLNILAAAGALALGAGVGGVFIAEGVVVVVSCALQALRARSLYAAPAAPIPADTMREVRAYLVPLSAVMLLQLLVWDRSEIFLLRIYVPSQEFAFYSLAYGLASRLMVLTVVVVGPLLPAFASLHGSGKDDEFRMVYRSAIRYTALVGAPLVGVGIALAPAGIVWLYGREYQPVVWVFSVFVAISLVGGLRDVAWAALQASGAKNSILSASIVGILIDLGLAITLIPRWGVTGAVVASSVARLVLSAWAFVAIHVMKGARLPAAELAKIAGATAAAFVVSRAVVGTGHPVEIVAAGAAGVVAFALACLALGGFTATERQWVRDLVCRLLGAPLTAPRKES